MTREEAIARIKDHKVVHKMNEPRAIYISEALDMAIEALEHLERNIISDTISRQAVLDAIDTYDKFGYTETGCFVREPKGDYVPYIHYNDVIKCIKNASPVTPQQRTGEWTYDKIDMNGYYLDSYECSVCKRSRNVDTPYCPNCGTKMQEVRRWKIDLS